MTVGFSFDDQLEHLHLNPVRKGSAKQMEVGRSSNDNSFAWQKATIAGSPIQVGYMRLP
ncbi:MAG: hypothetical protein WCD04_05130 [Terriglobia bacterium]